MTYLTRRENELIQLYLDAATEQLRHMGLVIETGHDLRECRAAYYEIPGHSKYPNTHDPDRCYLTPSNSFWVSFVDQVSTKPVVIGAQRIIETRSIISEIYTHRVFGNLKPTLDSYDIGLQENIRDLSGRLALGGGILTHEKFRKRGLGAKIARVFQALAIRHFEADYQISFTVDDAARRQFVKQGYGMAHSALAINGKAINGKNVGMMLNWTSRNDLLTRMEAELNAAHSGTAQTPITVSEQLYGPISLA